MKTKGYLKLFDGRKRVHNFIAIYKNDQLQGTKIISDPINENGYVLPRNITDLDDIGFDECSSCNSYFPDGLNECEHCEEKFCCDCAEDHKDEIETGGCNF
jgi:hypothetical protein